MQANAATWTMNGFLGWAFGARTLDRVSELLTQARRGVLCLSESPSDWEVRRQLAHVLRQIRQEADERLWRAEADQAGSLARLLGSRRFENDQVARLSTDFRTLEAVIVARVAHQQALQNAGAAHPPSPLGTAVAAQRA